MSLNINFDGKIRNYKLIDLHLDFVNEDNTYVVFFVYNVTDLKTVIFNKVIHITNPSEFYDNFRTNGISELYKLLCRDLGIDDSIVPENMEDIE